MISTTYAPKAFTGNSSAVTAYVCPWKALDADDLQVIVTDADGATTTLTNGSGMTVTLVGDTVEFVTDTGYDETYSLVAYLAMSLTQLVDLQLSSNNDPNIREAMFDRLTLLVQIALLGITSEAGVPISFPTNEPGATYVLPAPANRASSFLYFDSAGDMTTYLYATLLSDIRNLLVGDADLSDALANRVVSVAGDLTLSQGNAFRLFEVDTTDGAVSLYCPADDDAEIAIGTTWDVALVNTTNSLTFREGDGATILSAAGDTPAMEVRNAGATIVKTAANTYRIFGRLVGGA